ncbi:charged multivesicular body protein 7 [Platysternon megacephalum]|uniref:Charged multivesicular body protein 7 n=1 Tax=Platysternon megacephalum TaxID=55544 RepID=A0A4D9ET77_9SAUR|nr:charged multivesicular body protein 7 [Platysternon megacephalum]
MGKLVLLKIQQTMQTGAKKKKIEHPFLPKLKGFTKLLSSPTEIQFPANSGAYDKNKELRNSSFKEFPGLFSNPEDVRRTLLLASMFSVCTFFQLIIKLL